MARGKKTEMILEQEEKLQQALVPESEQPYKVPENWRWIHLNDSFDNHTDSKKKIQRKDYLEKGSLAIVDQGQEIIGGYSNDGEMQYKGTMPVIIFGDHTRCIKYVDFPFIQGADGIKVLVPKSFFFPKAFFYALQSIDIPNMGYRRHYPLFKNYSIPIPPLPEQQRIVDRIESLFAKLDEAKEKAQAVVDGFEDRKATILHKAFMGDLTKNWRKNNGIDYSKWKRYSLGDIIFLLSGQDFKPDLYSAEKTGIPYITGASNFDYKHVIINRWTDHPTVIARKGDVLLVCKGSGYGKTVIADFDEAHIARQIMALRTKETILNSFLFYYLQNEYEYLRANGQGLIPGISRKIVLNMRISVPSIEEQNETVYILENIFQKEQQAKDSAEQVIAQIDTMKKSILARAFRGELGTNDPSDESAEELLKRIL